MQTHARRQRTLVCAKKKLYRGNRNSATRFNDYKRENCTFKAYTKICTYTVCNLLANRYVHMLRMHMHTTHFIYKAALSNKRTAVTKRLNPSVFNKRKLLITLITTFPSSSVFYYFSFINTVRLTQNHATVKSSVIASTHSLYYMRTGSKQKSKEVPLSTNTVRCSAVRLKGAMDIKSSLLKESNLLTVLYDTTNCTSITATDWKTDRRTSCSQKNYETITLWLKHTTMYAQQLTWKRFVFDNDKQRRNQKLQNCILPHTLARAHAQSIASAVERGNNVDTTKHNRTIAPFQRRQLRFTIHEAHRHIVTYC